MRERFVTQTGALRAWVDMAVIVLAFTGLAVFTISYVTEQERRICGLLIVLDDTYAQTPPATATGQRVAAEIHDYRLKIGC